MLSRPRVDLERSAPAIAIVQTTGPVANASFADLVGRTEDDLRTERAWLAAAASDEDRARLFLAMRGEQPRAPIAFVGGDGEVRRLEMTVATVGDAVTWLAEPAAPESQVERRDHEGERFFELSRDMLVVVQRDGTIARASASFAEALGTDTASLVGERLVDLVVPGERDAILGRIDEIVRERRGGEIEVQMKTEGQPTRRIGWRGASSPSGRFYGVGRDVTDVHARITSLRAEEETARRMFEESPTPSAVVGGDGAIVRVNAALERLTRFDRAELVGMKLRDLVRPSSAGEVRETADGRRQMLCARRGLPWAWVEIATAPLGEGPSRHLVELHDIDARARTEQALRVSESLLREYAENLDGVAWLLDVKARRMLFVSPNFARAWGRPVAEVCTDLSAWFAAIVPEDRARVERAMAAALDSPYDCEYRVVGEDGVVRWVHDRASPIHGPDGSVHRIAGFAQDTTAQKRAEEELRASEDRYRRLVFVLPEAVIGLAADGTVTDANPAAAALLGVGVPAELIGSRLEEHLDGADVHAELAEVVAHRCRVEGVTRSVRRRSDGVAASIEISAAPFGDREGATLLLRDVTRRLESDAETGRQREERAAARALDQGDQRLREIIDLVPHFVFAKDASGRFLLVNRAVADAYGTTVAELEGKTDADFATAEDARRFRSDDAEVLATGLPKVVAEETITDASGRVRHLSTVKIPFSFSGSDVAAVLGVSTDVTERKKLEAQLVRAQKLEGLGRLAGGIAHDFNNGLSAILSFAELLVMTLESEPEARADAEAIREVALRAADLTRDLLMFSRQDEAQPSPVDVGEFVGRLDRLLRKVVGPDVQVVPDVAAAAAVVRVDPGRLEQVLVNLAINARDAMPRGGRLGVGARSVPGAEVAARAGVSAADGPWVEIAVSDSGTGIPDEILGRIFDPFFTTKEVGKGTGLGLATSYGIVRQAGGHLLVESALGVGTTFRILLPQVAEEAAPSGPRIAAPQRGDERVLFVEDNAFVREAVRRGLAGAGYRVVACATPEEALERASSPRADFDVVITDVVMPAMNGFAFAEALRRVRPELPVLFVSGYRGGAPSDPLGEATILEKPFTVEVLTRHLRAALDRRAGR